MKFLDHLFPGRRILAALKTIETELKAMAKTLDDILAAQAATLTKVTAETDAVTAIASFVTGLKQSITDLQAQLAAAGTDPAKLQAVSDNMDKINAGLDANAVAEAAVTNTPAAPAA